MRKYIYAARVVQRDLSIFGSTLRGIYIYMLISRFPAAHQQTPRNNYIDQVYWLTNKK